MPVPVRLIHPIYLDVPMLVSFAAAIEGGLSFGAEITEESTKSKSTEVTIAGKFGLGALFNRFLDISVEGSGEHDVADVARAVRKEARAHTEASVAILLYDRLRRAGGYIVDPKTLKDLESVEPGALVEMVGTIEKNAIDAMVDHVEAVRILGQMAVSNPPQPSPGPGGGKPRVIPATPSPLLQIRESLDQDRKRTPISNALLRCSTPPNANAIVTLRTANLRDLTLSELHKNAVRVLGKITRVVPEGQAISPFENYGLSLLKPAVLEGVFKTLAAHENLSVAYSEVELKGPAVQILPLMIFV